MSDYTKEEWDALKAIKGPTPIARWEDKYQPKGFSGYNRARRRANGQYRGFLVSGSGRSVRPADTKEALRDRITASRPSASV